ncbi:hypothetical protein DCAR_0312942 [Daucus carota subsp. sativus]|uniref:Uncharacterized protein n=1 Tax=Daucus carota subsp. sativus TaxID=79200 RepID=A0A166BP43_DAUCS|nr:hypothetical protein DCAR_0312942 [Daucus carota subsp. sativus]
MTVTFVTDVKTVETNAAVKGDPTATFECAVNIDDTKSKNRNGKMNRGKNGEYAKSAPRKLCNNYSSSHHLTNVCKNDVATPINAVKINGNLHRTPIMDKSMNECSDIDCMPCTTALLVVDSIPAVRTSLAVTSTLAVKAHTAFFTQTDSIVSTQPAVTQMQHPSAVLVEDDYNDDNVLISSFIKGTSKPSSSMDFSTAHTHAFRMSEGEKKKREIKEQRVSKQNERHPKCAGKRRGT